LGKFELFLLLIGIGALAFFSQMPTAHVPPASASSQQASQLPVPKPSAPVIGRGTFDGLPILARFSSDSFQVVDGDSIRIATADAGEVDLRLASIDAPEWNQTGGQAAKLHLEAITAGRRATFLQTDTDRYQRAVVFMFVDVPSLEDVTMRTQEINAQMVADGFAWHAVKYSSSERLNRLEVIAKAKRLGLWVDPNPQPPWEYRDRKHRAVAD